MKFKVMKSAGALPTEERVQKMSNLQWVWYYKNLIKDKEEEESLMKSRIDYLAFFVNPELHKSVMNISNGDLYSDNEEKANETQNIVKGGVYVNDDFERELKEALGNEEFTVLPDSSSAGNENMSENDFLKMAQQMQQQYDNNDVNKQNNNINTEDNEESKINEDYDENDLDYFE